MWPCWMLRWHLTQSATRDFWWSCIEIIAGIKLYKLSALRWPDLRAFHDQARCQTGWHSITISYIVFSLIKLLDQLTESRLGAIINNIYWGVLMYADDILNRPAYYRPCWTSSTNTPKDGTTNWMELSQLSWFWGKPPGPERQPEQHYRVWRLGSSTLCKVDGQYHLGILRSVYNSSVTRTMIEPQLDAQKPKYGKHT